MLRPNIFGPLGIFAICAKRLALPLQLSESIICVIIKISLSEQCNLSVEMVNKFIQVFIIVGEYEMVESKIFKSTKDGQSLFCCTDCDFSLSGRLHVFEHIETKHVQSSGYFCNICNKICATSAGLRMHFNRYHKNH